MAERAEWRPRLAGIKLPMLALVGEHDVLTPPAEAREMVAAVPGARLIELPDAGHSSPMESPEAVSTALLEFLAAVR
jgi:pimeloyl-ACP methyl ester carboxylesterase